MTRNVPLDHPDFGKAFPCTCQQPALEERRSARLRAMSNLEALADKTFESYTFDHPHITDAQLALMHSAYNQARHYANQPQGWLLLQGNYGCGKTHLAAAIAHYRLAQGEQVLFVTVPDLLDHLRSTFGPLAEIQYDELFEQVRNVPLLVLDDLGSESATSWAQEKLYQVINHRYVHRIPTVITTNTNLDLLDGRVRSRLIDWRLTQNLDLYILPDFRRPDTTPMQPSLFNPEMYRNMVFETFDLRQGSLPDDHQRNLRHAYETALNYAQKPQGWLLFIGPHGCGKTHLAAAIANYRRALGETVILVTTAELLDYLRAAFNPTATSPLDKRFNEIRLAHLLVIDQLDLSSATPWAREKLRQIADYRYLTRLPTVFTSTQVFEDLDSLLRSRLMDRRLCRVFAITAPDYEGGEAPPRRSKRMS